MRGERLKAKGKRLKDENEWRRPAAESAPSSGGFQPPISIPVAATFLSPFLAFGNSGTSWGADVMLSLASPFEGEAAA